MSKIRPMSSDVPDELNQRKIRRPLPRQNALEMTDHCNTCQQTPSNEDGNANSNNNDPSVRNSSTPPNKLQTRPHSEVASSPEDDGESRVPSKLHVYSKEGNLEMVMKMLKDGVDVDCTYRDASTRGMNSLIGAVKKRHFEVAEHLILYGARVNACEQTISRRAEVWRESYSPLHWAVEVKEERMVQLLLSHGADCNKQASLQDHQYVTPLHLAAQDGNTSICLLLLSNPDCLRDPVKITPKRNMITPLHQAAFNGHTETVRLLLNMGCNPNKQADNGYAALHYACQIGDPKMVAIILSWGGRHDLKSFTEVQSCITPLHLAVQSGNEPTIKLLARHGADLEAEKRLGKVGGVTPLHQAICQNKLNVVKLLLDLGANVQSKSGKSWYTACHIAAERGSLEMMELLLSSDVKADVNAKATLGEHGDVTPLHVASQFGHNEIIKRLVQAGADVNCVRRFGDRLGMNCLHLAVEFNHPETVQLLLSLGCEINAIDSLKYTALHTAVQHGRSDIVKLLLSSNKCNLKLKNVSGLTPKQLAKKTNSLNGIAILFRENKQISETREDVKTRRSKSAVLKYFCGL